MSDDNEMRNFDKKNILTKQNLRIFVILKTNTSPIFSWTAKIVHFCVIFNQAIYKEMNYLEVKLSARL